MKICAKCKREKSLSQFSRDRSHSSGKFLWCKACSKIIDQEFYARNRKRETARKRKFHAENREKENARNKRWAEAHRAERKEYQRNYYSENKEQLLANAKRRYAENPEKGRESYAKRRARKLDAFVAEVDRNEIFIRDNGTCHICKELVDPDKWHLDHIYPLSKGGTHEPDNVAVSHPECNMEKKVSIEFGGIKR